MIRGVSNLPFQVTIKLTLTSSKVKVIVAPKLKERGDIQWVIQFLQSNSLD
ncbi:protein of unknown function [Lactiplantibacillus plantarum]